MNNMFRANTSLEILDLSSLDMRQATTTAMLYNTPLKVLTLGPNSRLKDSYLQAPPTDETHTGKWMLQSSKKDGEKLTVTNDELMNYDGTHPGTYVWETKEATPVAGADVTVHYEDDKGEKISDDVVLKGNVGDDYTSEQKAIPGYTFSKVEGTATGK
ncbi:MucBP domain-containing protein, partial [Enterococcus faecalis]|nr:MucBP domain-containing protein [Enterococcus faecalis]